MAQSYRSWDSLLVSFMSLPILYSYNLPFLGLLPCPRSICLTVPRWHVIWGDFWYWIFEQVFAFIDCGTLPILGVAIAPPSPPFWGHKLGDHDEGQLGSVWVILSRTEVLRYWYWAEDGVQIHPEYGLGLGSLACPWYLVFQVFFWCIGWQGQLVIDLPFCTNLWIYSWVSCLLRMTNLLCDLVYTDEDLWLHLWNLFGLHALKFIQCTQYKITLKRLTGINSTYIS